MYEVCLVFLPLKPNPRAPFLALFLCHLGDAADAEAETLEALETFDLSVVSALPMLITAFPVCFRTWLTRACCDDDVVIEFSPVSCIT